MGFIQDLYRITLSVILTHNIAITQLVKELFYKACLPLCYEVIC